MFINKLKLHNFRCFENIEIEFTKPLTVIVGNNGAGKTSILEGGVIAVSSIFLGLDGIASGSIVDEDSLIKSYTLGMEVDDETQSQYPVVVSAEGNISNTSKQQKWTRSLNVKGGKTTIVDAKEIKEISLDYQERLRMGDELLCLPIVAYYGTGRLWDNHRAKRISTFTKNTRTNGYIHCLDGTASLKLMDDWFEKKTIQKYQYKEAGKGNVYELELVYEAMESCFEAVTGYSDVLIQYNLNLGQLVVYYTDKGKRTRIPLSLLSAGYKGTISLIADIAYRMTLLNPQLKERALVETEGVIFIDEIDLHLHPTWQQRILGDLMKIFPKVQFVVSTHAPAVINSTQSNQLRILNDYEICEVKQQVYGNDVNSILNNVMGAEERPVEIADLFKKFYNELNKSKFEQAEKILDEIDLLRGGSDKEVAGCRVKLKLERIRKGENA